MRNFMRNLNLALKMAKNDALLASQHFNEPQYANEIFKN